jgi:hypothetical protein
MRSRRLIGRPIFVSMLSLLMVVLAWQASPAPATGTMCRCPELTLDRYFERADIVVVGTARIVRRVSATGERPERLEVTVAPAFRPGPFKGSLTGVTLATPVGSASCGVEIVVGRVYVIFASRGDPADSSLAWFDTCSGSRVYGGGPDVYVSPFPELPNNRVIARLFELADSPAAPAQGVAQEFHTSPACWGEPRIYHQGTPPREFRERIRISRESRPFVAPGGEYSPNRGYRIWQFPSAPADQAPYLLIDNETPYPVRVTAVGAISLSARWVSEKLLFVRVSWSRVQFTDLLIDAESGRPIYEESARYGDAAFQQFQGQCLGQCPCLPVAGRADSLRASPRSVPLPGEQEGLGALQPDNLAYLDQDWDGRIFTEPGGRRFTISALKGTMGREEYPVTVHELREVANGYWILVSLYRVSPCSDPNAVPVHRGWVPAFSTAGRLVAGTWPGGC